MLGHNDLTYGDLPCVFQIIIIFSQKSTTKNVCTEGEFFLILPSAQVAKDVSVFGPRLAKFNNAFITLNMKSLG
ncbi:hypothetical protein V7S76_03570 [Aquirufa sp. ROCK2-A2]